jgi:hypothetical protein
VAAEPEAPLSAEARTVPWDLVLQGVGVGAAIAGWVAVVGGGRLWARFDAAHIPATQAIAGLPRELLIVEGLQLLLVPLLVGGLVAVLVFLSLRKKERDAEEAERRWRQTDEQAQERLAAAQAERDRTVRIQSAAQRARERAERQAAAARRRAGAGDSGAEDREPRETAVRQAGERFEEAQRNAAEAGARLNAATRDAETARRSFIKAKAVADRALMRPQIEPARSRRDGNEGSRWVPEAVEETVERYGAERAALIALGDAGHVRPA